MDAGDMNMEHKSQKRPHEQRGCVEIRWAGDDPDDVVAPWPRSLDGMPIVVHVERMSDGDIWMAIYPADREDPRWTANAEPDDERVVMWFHAKRKDELEWTVSERGS